MYGAAVNKTSASHKVLSFTMQIVMVVWQETNTCTTSKVVGGRLRYDSVFEVDIAMDEFCNTMSIIT